MFIGIFLRSGDSSYNYDKQLNFKIENIYEMVNHQLVYSYSPAISNL
jgi:hypothetical protein